MKLSNLLYFSIVPALVIIFNIAINPLDQWNIPRLHGINYKITESGFDRVIKSNQIKRNSYDTLIIGSSRAAIALSPYHAAFQSDSIYNLGLSGGGIYLQYVTLQHALLEHPIRKIVIAHDFFGYNAHWNLNQPRVYGHNEIEDLFFTENNSEKFTRIFKKIENTYENILGWKGTNSSMRTLISQHQKSPYFDRNGSWKDFGINTKNYAVQYDRVEKAFITESLYPAPSRIFSFTDKNTGYDSFELYRDLLKLAHKNGLQVYMIILPSPARNLMALKNLGLWSEYADWKVKLAAINESIAAELKTEPFIIWDFEIFNNEIETNNLLDQQPYFYEPFHPTPMVGEQILNRVFLDCLNNPCWPGIQLDTQTVSASINKLDADLQNWSLTYPEQMASLQNNINKTKNYRKVTDIP